MIGMIGISQSKPPSADRGKIEVPPGLGSSYSYRSHRERFM
jgi:hypothetical protein